MTLLEKQGKELIANWRYIRLGELCEINPRRPTIIRDDSCPTSFIPMESIDAIFGVISKPYVRPFSEIKKGYSFFINGDVLFAKITPCMQNGKHAIADKLIDGFGFGTTEFHVLRPKDNVISEWLWFFVRQPSFLNEAAEHFIGTVGQQRLPYDYLANLEIPVPPLSEQRRIADILREQMAAVEQARTAAQARLEAVKALSSSLLHQVFPQSGQPLPDGWRWVRLGEVCNLRTGGTPSKSDPTNFGGDIKWLVSGDIHQSEITDCVGRITAQGMTNSNASLLSPDCVLIALNGQGKTRGMVALLCVEATCNQSLVAMIARDRNIILPRFLLHQLQMRYQELRNLTGDSHRSGLSMRILDRLEVIIAPIEEQRRIVDVLEEQMAAVEKVREVAEDELKAVNALPSALLRQAFNGEA